MDNSEKARRKANEIVSNYKKAEFTAIFARLSTAENQDLEYERIVDEFEDMPGPSTEIRHQHLRDEQRSPSPATLVNATEFLCTDEERSTLIQVCEMFPNADLNTVAMLIAQSEQKDVNTIRNLLDDQLLPERARIEEQTRAQINLPIDLATSEDNCENKYSTRTNEEDNKNKDLPWTTVPMARLMPPENMTTSQAKTTVRLFSHIQKNIASSVSFCIHWAPFASTGILFDLFNNQFLVVDLGGITEKRNQCYTLNPFRIIQEVGSWSQFYCVDRDQSRSFILAIVEEMDTKKYFVAAFELQKTDTGNSVSVLDEHFLGVQAVDDTMLTYMIEDEKGKLYGVMFGRNNNLPKTTFFHVVQINVDKFGKIKSEILIHNREIQEHWHQPFCYNGNICFLPLSWPKNKIIVTALQSSDDNANEQIVEIKVPSNEEWPPFGIFSAPCFHNDLIFYYVFIKSEENVVENIGEVWALKMEDNSWVRCFALKGENVIVEWPFISVSSAGTLALQGYCTKSHVSSSEQFVHIYHLEFENTEHLFGLDYVSNRNSSDTDHSYTKGASVSSKDSIYSTNHMSKKDPNHSSTFESEDQHMTSEDEYVSKQTKRERKFRWKSISSHPPSETLVFSAVFPVETFCITKNKSTVVAFDNKNCCMIREFVENNRTWTKATFTDCDEFNFWNMDVFAQIIDVRAVSDAKCICLSNRAESDVFCLTLFEPKLGQESISRICVAEAEKLSCGNQSRAQLVENISGELFLVEHYVMHKRRTYFRVSKINIDEIKPLISVEILVKSKSLKGSWQNPFIVDNFVYFLTCKRNDNKVVSIAMNNGKRVPMYEITSTIGSAKWYSLPSKFWTSTCLYEEEQKILQYAYCPWKRTGHLWTFDWKQKQWTKYFEMKEHGKELKLYKVEDKLFLIGTCGKKRKKCKESTHVYKLSISLLAASINVFTAKFFINAQQYSALADTSENQIIIGSEKHGKSAIIKLKIFEALNHGVRVILYLTNTTLSQYCTDLSKSAADRLNGNDVEKLPYVEREFTEKCVPDNSLVVIDSVHTISYNLRQVFLSRKNQTQSSKLVVVFENTFPGIANSKKNWSASWHETKKRYVTESDYSSDPRDLEFQRPKAEDLPKHQQQKQNFMEKCKYAMNQFFNEWTNPQIQIQRCATIPACLDVKNSGRAKILLDPETIAESCQLSTKDIISKRNFQESSVIGQDAEDSVLAAFTDSEIGGFLIAAFESKNFANLLKISGYKAVSIEKQFECDFIFFHPQIGISLIEVKGTKEVSSMQKPLQKAREQLLKNKKGLTYLHQKLTGQELAVPIHIFACFPFINAENCSSFKETDDIIFRDTLTSRQLFLDLWTSKSKYIGENLFAMNSFQDFVSVIVGHQSTVHISQARNALDIHRQLTSQDYLKELGKDFSAWARELGKDFFPINLADSDNEQLMILNPEQLFVLRNSEHSRQLIVGPPGTGKTLLIMLKALQAARAEGNGIVWLCAQSQPLSEKFKLFLAANKNPPLKRKLVLGKVTDNVKQPNDEDDLFMDEQEFSNHTVKTMRLRQRSTVSGQTVVAITGHRFPNRILLANNEIATGDLDFKVFELKSVVRGSKNITNQWKHHFPDGYVNYGHNISGRPANSIRCSRQSMSSILLSEISSFLREIYQTENTNSKAHAARGIKARDIAVIVEDEALLKEIQEYFKKNWVDCGSIEEQLSDSSLIAVDIYQNALSFEWPIVFTVGNLSIQSDSSFGVVAASRAIAHLVNIFMAAPDTDVEMSNVSPEEKNNSTVDVAADKSDLDSKNCGKCDRKITDQFIRCAYCKIRFHPECFVPKLSSEVMSAIMHLEIVVCAQCKATFK